MARGDPLVLLHGGLDKIDMFGSNIGLLAETHQVIAIDLQGHGHTLPFGRPMSYEAMADDVAAVIRYLGFEKADIMGYSLGGDTALRVAIQHPDVVDKLVVVSAPYAWAGWLLMFADWDAVRTSHVASFFELLGGGLQDAQWDGSGMNANRLAIIPNATHYNIFADTRPGEAAIAFIDAPAQ